MTEDQLKRVLNTELANFFGQQARHFDERFDALRDELKSDISQVQESLDGIAKRLDDDDQERAAAEAQLARHETWIRQLAKNTGTELVNET